MPESYKRRVMSYASSLGWELDASRSHSEKLVFVKEGFCPLVFMALERRVWKKAFETFRPMWEERK